VRELVNKSPGRNMLYPGAGVGGHCIPKDPWLLSHQARAQGTSVRLIPAARAVNESMPLHMVDLLEDALAEVDIDLAEARVLVLGYAYLENSDDVRNSPSAVLISALHERGAEVMTHDPYVPGYQGDLYAIAEGCDAVVIMVKHDAYGEIDWETLRRRLVQPVVVDGRRVVGSTPAGFVVRAIGEAADVPGRDCCRCCPGVQRRSLDPACYRDHAGLRRSHRRGG
jgi:UDP-N-acetyl-D-mannosaminuronic acid dehydrogenase